MVNRLFVFKTQIDSTLLLYYYYLLVDRKPILVYPTAEASIASQSMNGQSVCYHGVVDSGRVDGGSLGVANCPQLHLGIY